MIPKKLKNFFISYFLIAFLLIPEISYAKDYFRIVVLGDMHLPVRSQNNEIEKVKNKIIKAKENTIEDINSWEDVDQVVAVGDITGEKGTINEYEYAKEFLKRLKKPYWLITGNHDYIYYGDIHEKPETVSIGERIRIRTEKLKRFSEYFKMAELYYAKSVLNYLLLFLSANEVDNQFSVEMHYSELNWLSKTLAQNKNRPTIIFYHAPLKGTVTNSSGGIAGDNMVAQPEGSIKSILAKNSQVFLWVSGHSHTAAYEPGFKAKYNLFEKKVLNIHNADMERSDIWTNSIYLYKNKVIIKTFDHKTGQWLNKLERKIKPPVLKK